MPGVRLASFAYVLKLVVPQETNGESASPRSGSLRARALVVAPDAVFSGEVVQQLREEGFFAEALTDAKTALARLESEPLDIVLCDKDLQVSKDRSFVELAHQAPCKPALLLFVKSNVGSSPKPEDLRASVLPRPVDPSELSRAVARALHARSLSLPGSSPGWTHALYNAFHQIATTANSEPNLSQMLDHLLRLCIEALGADSGSVMLASRTSPTSSALSIVCSHGLDLRESYAPVPVDSSSISGWVAENNRPLRLVASLESYPQFTQLASNPRLSESFIVPIAVRRDVLGIISLASKHPNHLGPEKLAFVLNAADIAAAAIHRDRLERAREHQDRLAVLGRLSAGLAHEMNNPLTFLRSNMNILSEMFVQKGGKFSPDDLEEIREILADSADGIERMVALVANLKGASRKTVGGMKEESLRSLIHRAEALVGPQIKHRVQLTVEPGEDLNLRCDGGRILQVLINLIMNAAQAVMQAGQVKVRSSRQGDWALVEVEDNGPGIPAEIAQHIFQPFFTTKPEGEGTGLGLSISQQIAVEHGGGLTFISAVGKGTRFKLHLPLDAGSVNRPLALVVDDDPAMLRALQRLLSEKFEVVTADGPEDALRVGLARKLDFILSDYALPEQNGVSLIKALRAQGQLARALLLTSLQNTEIDSALKQGIVEVVMRKPFNPTALMSAAVNLTSAD